MLRAGGQLGVAGLLLLLGDGWQPRPRPAALLGAGVVGAPPQQGAYLSVSASGQPQGAGCW